MSEYVMASPEAQEIWGYVILNGRPSVPFVDCKSEEEARSAVRPTDVDGKPVRSFRTLAKRTLGPVEVVEDETPKDATVGLEWAEYWED